MKQFLKEYWTEAFGIIVGIGLMVYSAISKDIIWFNFSVLIIYMNLNNFKTDLDSKKIKDLEKRLSSTEDSLNTLSNAILKIIKGVTDERS